MLLFDNYSAGCGGGIYYDMSDNQNKLDIINSTFKGNSVTGRSDSIYYGGGGIGIVYYDMEILGCLFDNNTAPNEGANMRLHKSSCCQYTTPPEYMSCINCIIFYNTSRSVGAINTLHANTSHENTSHDIHIGNIYTFTNTTIKIYSSTTLPLI